ncbi:uncharacterized protein LOC142168330 [Nicotiana tabacum]|uniref:Uncharacterized protein LOC142168330 n=1 Tax=Nicotiana tabacum TaxID=4097 RepID=A0AC58SJD2_TOBAC
MTELQIHRSTLPLTQIAVKGNDLAPHKIEFLLLRKFCETLTRGVLTWYSLLPEHSIDSFEMLADFFIKAHAGSRKVQARNVDIFRSAQGESELLREYVTRFQKEMMLLLAVLNEWAAEAFTKGLNLRSSDASRRLKESLLEFRATTWADVHNWYELKIRIEDDQVGFPSSTKGRGKNREKMKGDIDMDRRTSRGQFLPYERTEDRDRNFRTSYRFTVGGRTDRGRNNRSLQDREVSGSRGSSYPRLSEYNFNVSIVELVSAMRSIKEARFPRPMKSDPSQRDTNLWCEYHGTNGHRTGDCRNLREEVATLLKNGHLREFLSDRAKNNYGWNRGDAEASKAGEEPPCQTINMIFRGNEINGVTFSAAKKTKVSISHSKRLWEDDITFTDEDADGLLLPYNDAPVTT